MEKTIKENRFHTFDDFPAKGLDVITPHLNDIIESNTIPYDDKENLFLYWKDKI